tara:strand:- start:120 stop:938 length:819 start_codon:yes stop_codon:yes gene_type:complete
MILLTGASGFIGRNIQKYLNKKNINYKIITSKKNKYKYTNQNYVYIHSKNLFKESDFWWSQSLKNVDLVIHLAWYANHKDYLYSKKNLECLKGSKRIAKIAAKNSIKKFVGIGSCIEYENTNRKISVNSALNDSTVYGSTKIQFYNFLNKNFKKQNMSFLWCRLFFVYGEDDYSSKIYNYSKKQIIKGEKIILKDNSKILDFIPVELAAKKIVLASINKNTGVFNVCTGKGQSIDSFISNIAKKLKKKITLEVNNNFPKIKIIGYPSKILKN